MRWSYKGLVTIFAVFGILFGVTLACGSTESETPGSPCAANRRSDCRGHGDECGQFFLRIC